MLSFTGGVVGWMRNTSQPRMLSPTCAGQAYAVGEV